MPYAMVEFVKIPRWLWGLPAPIWLVQAERIRRMVEELKLKPIEDAHLPVSMEGGQPFAFAAAPEVTPKALIRPRPFPGGLRIPHLHLGDRIYQLNREQWDQFAKGVMAEMMERLGSAGTVGVRELAEISEIAYGL